MRTSWLWLARMLVLAVVGGLSLTFPAGASSALGAPDRAEIVAGVEWESMDGPPGAGRVLQLVQSTEPRHVLFALTETGVLRSSDKGREWASVDELEGRWISTIAPFGQDLIVCGEGIHRLSPTGLEELRGGHCDAVGTDADTIVAAQGSASRDGVRVWRHHGSEGWQDISPSAPLLGDLDLPPADAMGEFITGPILPAGDDILMGIRVLATDGSGVVDGGLYRWDEGAAAWSPVSLPTPEGVVLARLKADRSDPRRVIATFRDPMLHEFRHPISSLVFESADGGRSWQPVTDSKVMANGVTDVVDVRRTRYVLDPFDELILRIQGTETTVLRMPQIEGIRGGPLGLATILVDPEKPRIAYGMPGSDWELGLVRSTDRMKTWHKMDGSVVGSSPTIVVSHPDDSDVLMTSGNVIQESYSTDDGGKTWSLFSPTRAGDELRIDPHDSDHLLVIDESTTLFESRDGGGRFKPLAQEFSGAKVLDVAAAADGTGRIYASNLGVGISRRNGDVWEHMSGSPDYAYDIEIDPDDSRVVYATNSPKKFENHASVWRYRPDQAADFGWSEILRVDDAAGITSLRFDPSDHATLYAGVTGPEGGLWVSRDRGERWEELNPALTFTSVQGHSQLEVIPGEQDTVFAGTWGGGTFRSDDSGATWAKLDDGHTFSPTCIEVWSGDPNILYACDRTAPKVHRSTDGGRSWHEYFDFGGDHLTTTAIAIDPVDPEIIYAAAFRPPAAMLGSFYRISGGVVEADLGSRLPRAVLDIAIDERSPSRLLVTTHLHGLYASSNGGGTWRRLDDQASGLPRTGYLDVDIDPRDPDTLYAAALCGPVPAYVIKPLRGVLSQTEPFSNIDPEARCGLYRSADRGETWELILETQGEAKGVEISAASPDRILVADGSGGVWVSDDGGSNWRQENAGLGSTSVTAVSAGEDRLYAGTQGSGVYVGTVGANGSIRWDGSGSPRVHVHRVQIEIDPRDGERLYASAYPGGVLRSDDGGRTWAAKNFLTPSIRVDDPAVQGYYALDIDPADPDTIWLGVYGKGVIVSRDAREFGTFANGRDGELRGKHITSLQVDPRDSRHVVVGAEEGIFVTGDGGRTWQRSNKGLGTRDIRSLALAASGTSPFAADFRDGAEGGFVLEDGWSVSKDRLVGRGHAWANAGSSEWTDYSFTSRVRLRRGTLHINTRVNHDGRYFVGLHGAGVYLGKTTSAWQKHRELVEVAADIGPKAHRVRVDVKGPRIRVFLDGRKVIDHRDRRSHSSGSIAFETLDGSAASVDDVRVKFGRSPTRAYAGTGGYGVYRLDANDARWRHLGRTLGTGWWQPWERRMYQFSSIRFDPFDRGTIYYGHFPGGFFVSRDGGRSWRDSSVGLGNDGMFSLVQHPYDPRTLFAGTYNGIVKSTDGGATWEDSSEGIPPEQWPYTVAIDSDDPFVMYTSTKNGQNKGFCERNAFCGVVMKSTDGGATWRRIMSGLDPMTEFYTLLIYPPDHDVLFLSTSRGVFASLDAGERWWPMDTGLPTRHNQVRDNVADNLALGRDGRYLFLGLVKHGVWRADLAGIAEALTE